MVLCLGSPGEEPAEELTFVLLAASMAIVAIRVSTALPIAVLTLATVIVIAVVGFTFWHLHYC